MKGGNFFKWLKKSKVSLTFFKTNNSFFKSDSSYCVSYSSILRTKEGVFSSSGETIKECLEDLIKSINSRGIMEFYLPENDMNKFIEIKEKELLVEEIMDG